jgi:hypothetical protein
VSVEDDDSQAQYIVPSSASSKTGPWKISIDLGMLTLDEFCVTDSWGPVTRLHALPLTVMRSFLLGHQTSSMLLVLFSPDLVFRDGLLDLPDAGQA